MELKVDLRGSSEFSECCNDFISRPNKRKEMQTKLSGLRSNDDNDNINNILKQGWIVPVGSQATPPVFQS